jgi:hypothetical protein
MAWRQSFRERRSHRVADDLPKHGPAGSSAWRGLKARSLEVCEATLLAFRIGSFFALVSRLGLADDR